MGDRQPGTSRAPFDAFYQAEFARLATIATIVSGDPTWGEDLAQDALARAEQRWEQIQRYDRPGAWARRVVVNLAISRRRRLAAEARALLRIGPAPSATPAAGEPEVWAAVAALPPRQRAVVALHYLEDRPVAEIADILEVSVSAVTSNLHKARHRLATELDGQGQTETGADR